MLISPDYKLFQIIGYVSVSVVCLLVAGLVAFLISIRLTRTPATPTTNQRPKR